MKKINFHYRHMRIFVCHRSTPCRVKLVEFELNSVVEPMSSSTRVWSENIKSYHGLLLKFQARTKKNFGVTRWTRLKSSLNSNSLSKLGAIQSSAKTELAHAQLNSRKRNKSLFMKKNLSFSNILTVMLIDLNFDQYIICFKKSLLFSNLSQSFVPYYF